MAFGNKAKLTLFKLPAKDADDLNPAISTQCWLFDTERYRQAESSLLIQKLAYSSCYKCDTYFFFDNLT